MLRSMTGYGKSIVTLPGKKLTIEIKSLNSKQFDLNLRLPSIYREKESALRSFFAKEIGRGKVDASIFHEVTEADESTLINVSQVQNYIAQLKVIPEHDQADLVSIAMRLPDVLKINRPELSEEEWNSVFEGIKEALKAYNDFRNQEGQTLREDFELRIENIRSLSQQIEPFEKERSETIKSKLLKGLETVKEADQNRFEQELIYYLEKLDITEEKVRLKNHLDYFIETMNEGQDSGKKLGFIAQEIGREVNTTGSKANHAEIQKIVVQMKDELEKIKEQLSNVL